jgi:hypothetical protein
MAARKEPGQDHMIKLTHGGPQFVRRLQKFETRLQYSEGTEAIICFNAFTHHCLQTPSGGN